MKHLIICREYPPAPSGGIGTYVDNISRLLAQAGETVHVIGQLWEGAEKTIQEQCDGKLVIHRVPCEAWGAIFRLRPSPLIQSKTARALYGADFPPQCFSWLAGTLAERLVEEEGIDVIEAQDYEAPLYYFQLRRALGLGPKRCPPCVVHLHSPTEFIARYNEWNLALSRWQTAKRLEDYSILSADALLCPSTFLSRQVESHYKVQANGIEIIPYPLDDVVEVERDTETWSEGSICYVGRLEKRKGVLEWIDAAVGLAEHYETARFEFIGANVLGPNPILSEEVLNRHIPRHLQSRFIFHGVVNRSTISQFLQRAHIAVVPSRWENFPNTCVEAMASGLPVIASPEGGMKEMIVDGQTGWVAETGDSVGLQKALKRALEASPQRIAEMGRSASQSIQQMCNKQKILEKHLRFRNELVNRGARRPLRPPSLKALTVEKKTWTGLTVQEVLADCAVNGFGKTPQNSGNAESTSDILERFAELVAQDTNHVGTLTPYSKAIRSKEWDSRFQEPLATIRCLIRSPRITVRVLQQVAAKLARRTQTRIARYNL